jgi:oxaloacetate decarboxylase gamma subunit
MPVTDLLMEGVNLMLLGMGIVFSFLALLVLAMSGMSRLAHALTSEDVHKTPSSVAPAPKGAEGSEELIAVITAAISRYRKNH